MKVVVTGAAGTVGSYVVHQLAEEGHIVIAVDLPNTSIPQLDGVIHYQADLTKLSFEEAKVLVNSTDAVIHTAAIVDISKSREEIWPLNVEATRNLALAASEESSCKFIFISSASIYAPSNICINENHKILPTSPYEESKVQGEAAVQVIGEYAAKGFSWTTLRPALIYGPRARFLGATLAAIPPIMKMLGIRIGLKGGPITNWVHAEDVARAAVHCLTCKDTNNRTFNVADDSPTGFGDTVSDYMEAYGIDLTTKVSLPSLLTLRLLKPVIDNRITFNVVNAPLKKVWNLVKSLYRLPNPGPLSVKVDQEVCPYIFHNTVFNNLALKSTGFKLKWPNPKPAIPYVLDWYQEHEWIP